MQVGHAAAPPPLPPVPQPLLLRHPLLCHPLFHHPFTELRTPPPPCGRGCPPPHCVPKWVRPIVCSRRKEELHSSVFAFLTLAPYPLATCALLEGGSGNVRVFQDRVEVCTQVLATCAAEGVVLGDDPQPLTALMGSFVAAAVDAPATMAQTLGVLAERLCALGAGPPGNPLADALLPRLLHTALDAVVTCKLTHQGMVHAVVAFIAGVTRLQQHLVSKVRRGHHGAAGQGTCTVLRGPVVLLVALCLLVVGEKRVRCVRWSQPCCDVSGWWALVWLGGREM